MDFAHLVNFSCLGLNLLDVTKFSFFAAYSDSKGNNEKKALEAASQLWNTFSLGACRKLELL